MKAKFTLLLLVPMLLLSICGFAYAQWNDVIVVSSTMTFGQWGDLNMGFIQPLTCTEYHIDPATGVLVPGEYLGKDVGKCECQYKDLVTDTDTGESANKTLIITINNAYPSYEAHCNFTLKNIGTLTLHINETVISDPNGALTWDPNQNALVDADGNHITIAITPPPVCNELDPGDTAEFELAIHITQSTEECHTYKFKIQIMYEEAT